MRRHAAWAMVGGFLVGCSTNGTSGHGGAGTTGTGTGSGTTSATATGAGGATTSGTMSTGTTMTSTTGTSSTSATGTTTGTGTTTSTTSSTSTGGLNSTPGKVACGTSTCTTPGQHCCLGGANGPFCSNIDCPVGDTTFACDQTADCPANTVCCFQGFNGASHYEEARCLTAAQCTIQLCGAAADCPPAKQCTAQTCYTQAVQSCGGLPAQQCP